MPISLDSQRGMRSLQQLSFCYLCGVTFGDREDRNRDHVPPSSIFATADRDFPLVLPTHITCNGGWTEHDEAIGQLVGVLHGHEVDPGRTVLRMRAGRFEDGSPGLAAELDLRRMIHRCVRGFHAALYRSPLRMSPAAGYSICPPVPEARARPDGTIDFLDVPEVVPKLVLALKRNRAVGGLDRILCRNGRCRYECVWERADNGQPICIYGFDLYGWRNLGDEHFERRGCVGVYWLGDGGIPDGAARATGEELAVPNRDRFDPFGN